MLLPQVCVYVSVRIILRKDYFSASKSECRELLVDQGDDLRLDSALPFVREACDDPDPAHKGSIVSGEFSLRPC